MKLRSGVSTHCIFNSCARPTAAGYSTLPPAGIATKDFTKCDRTLCANKATETTCTIGCGQGYVLAPGAARTNVTCSLVKNTPTWTKVAWPASVRMSSSVVLGYCRPHLLISGFASCLHIGAFFRSTCFIRFLDDVEPYPNHSKIISNGSLRSTVGCSALPTIAGVADKDLAKYDRSGCANRATGRTCTVGCAPGFVLAPGSAQANFTCSSSAENGPTWIISQKWPTCVRMSAIPSPVWLAPLVVII